MQFVNITFPDCIAFGAQFSPKWQTTVRKAWGGQITANQDWQDMLHEADVGFAVRTVEDYAQIKAHFSSVRGQAFYFPIKDYTDFEADSTNGVLLSSAGAVVSADGTFYLHKRYGSGASAYDRPITRPDATNALPDQLQARVYRTRSSARSDITGAGAVITYTTGAVAITGHSSGDTYDWVGTFKVPMKYMVDKLPAVIVNREGSPDGQHLVECPPIPLEEVPE